DFDRRIAATDLDDHGAVEIGRAGRFISAMLQLQRGAGGEVQGEPITVYTTAGRGRDGATVSKRCIVSQLNGAARSFNQSDIASAVPIVVIGGGLKDQRLANDVGAEARIIDNARRDRAKPRYAVHSSVRDQTPLQRPAVE